MGKKEETCTEKCNLEELVSMGFDDSLSKQVMQITHGNLSAAINILMTQDNSIYYPNNELQTHPPPSNTHQSLSQSSNKHSNIPNQNSLNKKSSKGYSETVMNINNDDIHIQNLISMGFDENSSKQVLLQTRGNVHDAVNILTTQSTNKYYYKNELQTYSSRW